MREVDPGVGFGRDHRDRAFVRNGLADRVRAIGLVRDDSSGPFAPSGEGPERLAVTGLRACDLDPQRPPAMIYSGVNL